MDVREEILTNRSLKGGIEMQITWVVNCKCHTTSNQNSESELFNEELFENFKIISYY